MQIEELITDDITPLNGQDSISMALNRMQKLQVSCLPVVDPTTNKLVGQLRENQLRGGEKGGTDAELEQIAGQELEEPVKVFKRQHVFEAARLMLQYELKMLPVVDEEITFMGFVSRQKLWEILPDMLNLDTNGSILTIELDKVDFTLSEIVHHIEVEGAKIMGLAVERPQTEGDPFKVSVKLNLKDATRVSSSLRRHDYSVVSEDASRDVFGFDMENRADELLNYIDM